MMNNPPTQALSPSRVVRLGAWLTGLLLFWLYSQEDVFGSMGLLLGCAGLPWSLQIIARETTSRRTMLTSLLILLLVMFLPTLSDIPCNVPHLILTLLFFIHGLPLLASRRRVSWLAFALLTLASTVYLTPMLYVWHEHCSPSTAAWSVLFQTNPTECCEYILSHSRLIYFLPIAALPAMLVLTSRTIQSSHLPWRTLIPFPCIFAAQVWTGSAGDIYRAFWETQGTLEHCHHLANIRSQCLEARPFTAQAGREPLKVMVIIGESTTRRHMGVYGYPANTTPNLSRRLAQGELLLFRNTISPDVLTMNALNQVLTDSNRDNPLPFHQSISAVDVFRKAGFQVSWISNQKQAGIFDTECAIIARSSHTCRFSANHVGWIDNAMPDEVLLPMVSSALPHDRRPALCFVHLMGAHFDYQRRVPKGYQPPLAGGCPDSEAYDRAVHYTDQIVSNLIQQAEAAGFDAVVYLSDHGEVPHDGTSHNPQRYAPEMVEIPFLIWFSPSYRSTHPKRIQQFQGYVQRSQMTDDFFHVLMDLAGVKGSLFDATRSVLSPVYQERPRRVTSMQHLYAPGSSPYHREARPEVSAHAHSKPAKAG